MECFYPALVTYCFPGDLIYLFFFKLVFMTTYSAVGWVRVFSSHPVLLDHPVFSDVLGATCRQRQVPVDYSQSKTAELKGTHGLEGCLPLKVKAHNQRHIYFENSSGMAEFPGDIV